eukprot:g4011.t1
MEEYEFVIGEGGMNSSINTLKQGQDEETSYDDFSAHQKRIFDILVMSFCSLSIVGALFILISYLIFYHINRRRKAGFLEQLGAKQVNESSLIISMAISNLIQHTNQLIGAVTSYAFERDGWMEKGNAVCQIQAFVEQLFPLATSFWALCIAITMYRLIVLKTSSETLYPVYHAICWGIPLILAIIGSVGDMYGRAGNWCWIRNEKKQIYMQYIEMLAVLLIISGFYLRVLFYVIKHRGVGSSLVRNRQRKTVHRIAWFPFVFMLSWSGGLINRLHNVVASHESFALYCLMYTTIPSMGWLNAFAYALTNTEIKLMYRDLYRGMCGKEGNQLSKIDTIDAALLPPNMRAALVLDGGGAEDRDYDSDRLDIDDDRGGLRTHFSNRSGSMGSDAQIIDLLSSPSVDDPYSPVGINVGSVPAGGDRDASVLLVKSPNALPPFRYE